MADRSIVAAAAVAVVLAVACSAPADRATPRSSSSSPTSSPTVSNPPLRTVQLQFGDRIVTAEVADDQRERLLGLMHRTELGRDAGMLFVFPAKTSGGFWMKNTLIPLQIAYLGREDGGFEVLKILDMVPCEADPCRNYPPGVQYDAALEMTAGWFDSAGVEAGDTVEVRGELE